MHSVPALIPAGFQESSTWQFSWNRQASFHSGLLLLPPPTRPDQLCEAACRCPSPGQPAQESTPLRRRDEAAAPGQVHAVRCRRGSLLSRHTQKRFPSHPSCHKTQSPHLVLSLLLSVISCPGQQSPSNYHVIVIICLSVSQISPKPVLNSCKTLKSNH